MIFIYIYGSNDMKRLKVLKGIEDELRQNYRGHNNENLFFIDAYGMNHFTSGASTYNGQPIVIFSNLDINECKMEQLDCRGTWRKLLNNQRLTALDKYPISKQLNAFIITTKTVPRKFLKLIYGNDDYIIENILKSNEPFNGNYMNFINSSNI